MDLLKEFAKDIRDKKIDEYTRIYIKNLFDFKVPLLKYFTHLSESELFELSKVSVVKFLNGFINDSAIDEVKEGMKRWEEDNLEGGLSKSSIVSSDLVLIYSAQRVSLLSMLPDYTTDVKLSSGISIQLETYYREAQEIAWQTLGKIQDKGKQKQIEAEDRFKDIFDNASDMVHLISPEGEILVANQAWLKKLGYNEQELVGKSIYSFICEPERDKFKSARERVIRTREVGRIETCLITKAGKEIFVEGTVTCSFKEEKIIYTQGIWHDVTQRKAYERRIKEYTNELKEREDNIRSLIANAPDAIIVIDEKSVIQIWNPKSEQIFGWMEEDVVGKPLSDTIVPPQHREAHAKGMERYLKTGETQILNRTIEITALNKAGKEFFISLTISESKRKGESVFIAFIRDISEDKKRQQELEKRRIMVEQTNEKLEQFARLASHDLKEPVRKIMTNSDLLLTRYSKSLTEEVQKRILKINESAQRMGNLIEGVLQYSSVSDETDLFVSVDMDVILEDVLADLESSIENKKVEVKKVSLPEIEGNPLQMRQLLQNIISNAIKYSDPQRPPLIEISTGTSDDNFLEIIIRDNGIGFNNEYAEKIFEIFQRLSTKKEYEGLGIGLALCKRIVEAHHGTISAKSELGKGSVFNIKLPVKQA
ncbi:MAG: PAS domain S-box protein [Bacteroidota bacterium]|nr:PAS domain S-box protein [Bacteroidota bacterium]